VKLEPHEEAELYILVVDALDVRGTEAFEPALQRFAEWMDRIPYGRCKLFLERRAEKRRMRNERLIQLLGETDPARILSERVS
jgi:hypothetical protein